MKLFQIVGFAFLNMVFLSQASALQVAGREFPETVTAGEAQLKANGSGIRVATRFGLNFKVYAGVFYSSAKMTTAEQVMSGEGPYVITMNYLMRVSGSDVAEALETGLVNNCQLEKQKCDEARKQIKQLTAKMPDLLNKSTFEFRIFSDRVEYNVDGRKQLAGTLAGADMAKAILGIYFGPKPASEELKKGFLASP